MDKKHSPLLTTLICLLFAGPSFAEYEVVNDPLDSPEHCCGTVVGIGAADQGFIPGVGWEQRNGNARIEYDFGPDGIDQGIIELDVTNFDPTTQLIGMTGTDDYHNLLTFYEGPSKQHHGCYDNLESCMEIQIVGQDDSDINRDNRVKYLITTYGTGCDGPPGHCNGKYTQPRSGIEWDLSETYHFLIEWELTHARMVVTAGSSGARHSVEYDLYWAPESPECTLNFRYFFIGRDEGNYGKPIRGPIWSNLLITSFDNSPYCGNGAVEGSEECDRAVPEGAACSDYGFYSGDLDCNFCECSIITDGCSGLCGDGTCQPEHEDCSSCPEDCGACDTADSVEPVPDMPDATSDIVIPDIVEDDQTEVYPDVSQDPAVDEDDDAGTGNITTGGCSCSMIL